MKLVVGLGNPQVRYANTRHNAGYLFVDELRKTKLPKEFVVKKSGVFMNDSGSFVKKLATSYKLPATSLYIAHDDLDIKLGAYKIQFGKGPKVHNGVGDIETKLGTDAFWRIRLGVDNRDPHNRTQGEAYVLQDFSEDERKIINSVIKKICKEISRSL